MGSRLKIELANIENCVTVGDTFPKNLLIVSVHSIESELYLR
jgi:hypothetical protein